MRTTIVAALLLALAGCASEPKTPKPNKIVEVESSNELGATLLASFECMGETTTGVRLISQDGNKYKFECFEIDD